VRGLNVCSVESLRMHRRLRTIYTILIRKLGGTRHLGRLWRRWEDIIKIDLIEAGGEYVDYTKHVNAPSSSIKVGTFLDQLGNN
jgi:hypothetical protein